MIHILCFILLTINQNELDINHFFSHCSIYNFFKYCLSLYGYLYMFPMYTKRILEVVDVHVCFIWCYNCRKYKTCKSWYFFLPSNHVYRKAFTEPNVQGCQKRYSRGWMQIIFDFYTIGVIIGTVIGNISFLFDFTNVWDFI